MHVVRIPPGHVQGYSGQGRLRGSAKRLATPSPSAVASRTKVLRSGLRAWRSMCATTGRLTPDWAARSSWVQASASRARTMLRDSISRTSLSDSLESSVLSLRSEPVRTPSPLAKASILSSERVRSSPCSSRCSVLRSIRQCSASARVLQLAAFLSIRTFTASCWRRACAVSVGSAAGSDT